MHIAPGIHCTLPLGPCTRAVTPSTYCKIPYSLPAHTLFFFVTCNHQKDDRPEHPRCVSAKKSGWKDLVPRRRMCQELQQSLDCASVNEKGLAESTVWGCVCLRTLILPAEADLTAMSGSLHCSWGSESFKRKRGKEKNGKYLTVEDPPWPKIASVSANPQLLVRFCKVSPNLLFMQNCSVPELSWQYYSHRLLANCPQQAFFSTFSSLEFAIWTS